MIIYGQEQVKRLEAQLRRIATQLAEAPDRPFVFGPEHIEMVLRITNRVESRMKALIARFLRVPPDRYEFFAGRIMNTSVTAFGSKVKIIFAIASELGVEIDRNPFHVLLSRRNGIAHQDFGAALRLRSDSVGERAFEILVESLKGNGELERINRDLAFEQFILSVEPIEEALVRVESAIDSITPHQLPNGEA